MPARERYSFAVKERAFGRFSSKTLTCIHELDRYDILAGL